MGEQFVIASKKEKVIEKYLRLTTLELFLLKVAFYPHLIGKLLHYCQMSSQTLRKKGQKKNSEQKYETL